MKKNNSDRALEKRLRAARKALQYVNSKSAERQEVMANYLKFPNVVPPVEYLDETLKKGNNL